MNFLERFPTLLLLCLLLGATVFVSGCASDDEPETPLIQNEFLVDYSLKADYSQTNLVTFATLAGLGNLTGLIGTGMDIYSIRYNSVYQGNPILASAAVAVPKTDFNGRPPIIGACRGTIFADLEAPSRTALFYGFEVFAAAGYATVLPDYFGFGESSDIVHPYYNKAASAQATIDAMLATQELMAELERPTNGQHFLFGYSQGGSTAMATLQAIESDPSIDLEIVATASGAGAYDINNVTDIVIAQETFPAPSFLAFLVYSYNEVNGWERPLSDFYQEPYLSKLPGLFNGQLNGAQIDAELTDTVSNLFTESFITGLTNDTDLLFRDAFTANSVYDWAPNSLVRLYHSSGDEIIPYSDTERTVQIMQDNNASSVELINVGTESHADAAREVIEFAFPWFETLRTQ